MRRHVGATLTELARVPTFLAEHSHTLSPDALNLLLDIVEGDYVAALGLLCRRAEGDYSTDKRPLQFPQVTWQGQKRAAGLGCRGLFEGWVKERKPAPSTVNRWRSVLLALEERFKDRDVASITNEEAIECKGILVTEERSAEVANDVWLINPKDATAYSNRARAYVMVGRRPRASQMPSVPWNWPPTTRVRSIYVVASSRRWGDARRRLLTFAVHCRSTRLSRSAEMR
jgi:hypothetical protein